jgi:CRP-like cAMP-binding protein
MSVVNPWAAGTFMGELRAKAQQELLTLGARYEYPAGVHLVQEGSPGTDVYLLTPITPNMSACAKVTLNSNNGCEGLLGLRSGGDLIGELAALCAAPRSATVTTMIPTAAYKFTSGTFVEFLDRHPDAITNVFKTISRRLSWANRRRLEIAGYNVDARLARVILEIAEDHGRRTSHGMDVGVRLTQIEWGQLIGAHPRAINNGIKILHDLQLIEYQRRSLTIVDLAGLRRYGA